VIRNRVFVSRCDNQETDLRQNPHSPSQINQCGSPQSALAAPDTDAFAMVIFPFIGLKNERFDQALVRSIIPTGVRLPKTHRKPVRLWRFAWDLGDTGWRPSAPAFLPRADHSPTR
jgi:hypothetical protein